MARLYLIRRNLESFLGPMTVEELAKSYERMHFGLQDEVSGHCGKWVSFDDLDELEKIYPELSHVVREKMLGGWGVSEHTATRLVKNKKERSSHKKSHWGFLFLVVCFGSAAALAAMFFANQKFSSRIFQMSGDQNLISARTYLSENRLDDFQNHLEAIVDDVSERAKRSRKNYHDWIPFLRAYAFLDGGRIDNFPPRLLRGMGTLHAPQDCSIQYWKQQWRSGERGLNQFTRNDALSNQPWVQILSWDPYWIQRRNKDATWIYPQSYYEGCLMMAIEAWKRIDSNRPSAAKDQYGVLARLEFLLSTTRGQIVTHEFDATTSVSSLTCLDRAMQESDLARCRTEHNHGSQWQELLERRRRLTQIRIIIDNGTRHLDNQSLTQISSLSARLPNEDPFNQFNYQAELRFYRSLLRHNGNTREAARQVSFEFKDVNFIPSSNTQ